MLVLKNHFVREVGCFLRAGHIYIYIFVQKMCGILLRASAMYCVGVAECSGTT